MKAIETRYNGRRYRSRLEARWAVLLDALHVKFDYEPEGFQLSAGLFYLPDFWLPGHGCWVEIKPAALQSEEAQKCALLAGDGHTAVYAFCGSIDPNEPPTAKLFSGIRFQDGFVEEQDGYEWFVCSGCGPLLAWSRGRCPRCDSLLDPEHPLLLEAYEAAAGARFEYGERGAAV